MQRYIPTPYVYIIHSFFWIQYMAEIQEVYGQSYEHEASLQRIRYIVGIIASNLVHLHLSTQLESHSLCNGANMLPESVQSLVDRVKELNPKMYLQHINKTTSKVNMFPYLIDGE